MREGLRDFLLRDDLQLFYGGKIWNNHRKIKV